MHGKQRKRKKGRSERVSERKLIKRVKMHRLYRLLSKLSWSKPT
jgi:hypothetical protein